MKIKSKAFAFILSFILLFTTLSVTCFADASSGQFRPGDVYTFKDELTFYSVFQNDVEFESNGITFESIAVRYNNGYYVEYSFSDNDDNWTDIIVYENGSWLDQAYRSITFVTRYSPSFNDSAFGFFIENEAPTEAGFYGILYNTLRNAVFGDSDVEPYQELALTLTTFVLCICCVLLPLIVIFVLMKYFLSLVARY